jgi:PhnB protein
MKWNPHLAFDGRCKEAFEFYERCLGGKIVAMLGYADMPNAQDVPADMRGRIMHSRIVLRDQVLMGCDAHPDIPYEGIRGCDVAVQVETPAEAERLFAVLSEGARSRCRSARPSTASASACSPTGSASPG